MRFWSEGLGDQELVMALDRAKIRRTGDQMVLTGIVESPAPWEYEVKIGFDDWKKILRTATSQEACGFIATHTDLGLLLSMAWSVVKFVVLLGYYRAVRLIGLGREEGLASNTLEEAGPRGS
ncbi:MAG: hypothetical protein ACHP7N_15155 [Caulobacterales bacterium]